MPTTAEIKSRIVSDVTSRTEPQSITKGNVGGLMEDLVDHSDENLQSAKNYADTAIAGQLTDIYRIVGPYDASVGTFPTVGKGPGGSVESGDTYNVTVPGTIGGVAYTNGDNFYALVDNPGQTASNWSKFAKNTELATDENQGTAFLYDELGTNTNGSVTQRVISEIAASVGGVTKIAKVPLSSSALLTLKTAPVTLIPGEAGKVKFPKFVYLVYTFGTTAYQNMGNLQLRVGAQPVASFNASSLVGNASGFNVNYAFTSSGSTGVELENQPVTMTTSAISNPTSGDGTAIVYVEYIEIVL